MLAFAALPKLATVSSKGYGPLRQLSRATTPLAESNGFRSKRHLNRLSNAALFPSNRVLGSKLALPLRTRRSQSLWHGGGHHHTHFGGRRDHPIKGHHPNVDPHHYNQVKDEDHEAGTQVTVLGIFINIGLSLGKGVAGMLGNSTAMIADAVHSLGDLGSDAVTLYTHKISSRGPSPSYPYGYGRFDSLGGFVVSLLLVGTGAGIGYHAALDFFAAAGEPPTAIALYAAVASVVAKEVLFQMTLKTATKINSKVLVANAWHHRSDAISSGLAFLGIGGEMLGIPHMDALAGLAVSGIIIKAALPVIRDSVDEITDRNDFIMVDRAIRDLASSQHLNIDRLRIRKSGNHLIAEITIIVDPKDQATFLSMTREFKTLVRQKSPILQDISVELQEVGLEEYHPEHGQHPPGEGPDIASAHQRVERESKNIFPKVNQP